jgi:NTE family protein
MYLFFEQFTRTFSPYEWNLFDINPLRDLLTAQVDFERVNRCGQTKVFVTATNVRTGRAKIFAQPNLSVDTIMASACLPFMFKAVEIDGEAYWDGGYVGNPALFPLVEDRTTQDLVVCKINPIVRDELPTSGRDILNRLNEVTFNSSLLKELRVIELLHELIDAENLESERYRKLFVHLIHASEELQHLDASSKLNAEWDYLVYLKERGRGWAERFLAEHYDDIGVRGTLDIKDLFADSFKPPRLQHQERTGGSAAE